MATFVNRFVRNLSSSTYFSHRLKNHIFLTPSAVSNIHKHNADLHSLSAVENNSNEQSNEEETQPVIKFRYSRKMPVRVRKAQSSIHNTAVELALNSVVKIFTVSCSPNYLLPWQNKGQRETMGSGFVILGRMILTNAHVVADHSFVLVRKHGSPTKYRAQVKAVGHECDLALLVVESEEFWDGMVPLEFGDIPFLQEAVAVVGYPQGGDTISVTKGVVSRVEPTQYVHGASQLMAIQIDAAINPGNSGGPAINGKKVAGVAFQNLSNAENIGYIIPVPVIRHFISGVEDNGKYIGFCSMGLSCQTTENVHLRNHYGMQPHMTGVLVSKINPLSDAYKVLKKDDIILSFDGVPIANDGTVTFRNRERITFDYLVSMKQPNEKAVVKVLREGKEHELSIVLQPIQPLVPVHQFDKLPSYYIFAGLVFVPLTQPYLHEYGEDWYNASPRRLCERALRELPKKENQQLVILSQVLMDDINAGYERLAELQVLKVNGTEVDNLKHLCQLVENCSSDSLRFDLDDDRVIVLNYGIAKVATSRILKRHRIPSSMSADLVDAQNNLQDGSFVECRVGRWRPEVAVAHTIGHVAATVSMSKVAVSFTHIIKSGEPALSVFVSSMLLGEALPLKVYLSLLPIIGGCALAAVTELNFNMIGFMGAMISNMAFVFRNIFSKKGMKGMSVSGMNYYACLSILSLLILTPFAIAVEGPNLWAAGWQTAVSQIGPNFVWWVVAQSVFYHLYNQVSYMSLDQISPLTFSIGNTMKRISVILSSILIFHTPVQPINALGAAIAILGTFLYSQSQAKQ